jgi:hypothetical protein
MDVLVAPVTDNQGLTAARAAIPHQKTAGSPLALKDQGDSLDLLIMDYHQRGDECCHKVC